MLFLLSQMLVQTLLQVLRDLDSQFCIAIPTTSIWLYKIHLILLLLSETSADLLQHIFIKAHVHQLIWRYQEVEREKEENIQQIVEEHSSQSEPEEEESKYYSKFVEEGSEAIRTMTGFLISEFMELYSLVEKSLKVQGRGKKPQIGPLYSFFFTLVMLKHYESWDKFATTYGMKKNVITNAITKTLEKIKVQQKL